MSTPPRHLAVLVLTACLALTLSACSSDDGDDGGSTTRATTIAGLKGDQTAGKTTYDNTCAACHKVDGTGDIGPNLVTGTKAALTVTAVATVVVDGQGTMPSYSTLTDQDIANTISYVKGQLAGK